jgi:hypothetical protein
MIPADGPARPAPAPPRSGWWAATAVVAFASSAAAVVCLHLLRPDLSPADHRLSEYAVGPWGWLMTTAFVTFAGGLLALRRALPARGRLGPVRLLLGVAALGMAASAAFETDVSRPDALRETIHSTASTSAFLSLVAAAVWTATIGRGAAAWRTSAAVPDLVTGLAALGAVISPIAHDGPWTGAVQRASYVVLMIWLVLASRAADGAAAGPHGLRPW